VRGSLVMRDMRYRIFPGCRSSDFFCRVHLLVAVSTASRISLAMLRGRGLVIWLLRVVGEDDRTLASVGELDARRGQVKRADDRLAGVGAHLGKRALQSFRRRSEGAERIGDRGAPVGPGHELAGYAVELEEAFDGDVLAAFLQAGLMQPEGELDDVGDAVVALSWTPDLGPLAKV
jgi:hypothetical protein